MFFRSIGSNLNVKLQNWCELVPVKIREKIPFFG
jgi:hypothetical protein